MKFTVTCCAALLYAVAACNVTDDRPETLAYVTETILAPSCGTAECHSAFKLQSGYAFDSVAGAQAAFASDGRLIPPCPVVPCNETLGPSLLLQVISKKGPFQPGEIPRMPLDRPLPNLDVYFISTWIRDGAEGFDRSAGQ